MASVVDQRLVQRRGGVCAKIPVACMVEQLLSEAGIDIKRLTVLDTTYGEGRFWAASRPRVLIGADIAVIDWVVEPDVFIKRPAWQSWRVVKRLGLQVDLVAVDPPWIERGNSKRRHFGINKALGSPRLILEAATTAAKELGARWLLVHFKTRYMPQGWTIITEKRWLPVTRYIDYSKNNPTTWWGILAKAAEG